MGGIYTTDNSNPCIGTRVTVTYLRDWQGRPTGVRFVGELVGFMKRGIRNWSGILLTDSGRNIKVPWCRDIVEIELDPDIF